MDRRHVLRVASLGLTGIVGCLDSSPGQTETRVTLASVDDPPELPVTPTVEVIESTPTQSAPPSLRVTVRNTATYQIEVGEERAIVFAYVSSRDPPGLTLLPEPAENYPAVEPGCWRLAEQIAILEYYGVVRLAPGQSLSQAVGVWGSSDQARGCLPIGRFRFSSSYTVARDESPDLDESDAQMAWGFALDVSRIASSGLV